MTKKPINQSRKKRNSVVMPTPANEDGQGLKHILGAVKNVIAKARQKMLGHV